MSPASLPLSMTISGVIGVAPRATIYALKVLGADGSGSFSNMIAALQWAVDHDIQITNNSYGSAQSPGFAVQSAFENAAAGGMLHVAAAGNSGTCAGTGDSVLYPARYASVIAVSATDAADVSQCFSSTGPKVELAAPGAAVNSTIPGGGYEVLSGTSMASPHVAGTAALVMSSGVADSNGNGRVNDEVRQILITTAQDFGNPGRDNVVRIWTRRRVGGGAAASAAATRCDPHGHHRQGELHKQYRYCRPPDDPGEGREWRRVDRLERWCVRHRPRRHQSTRQSD